MSEPIRPDQVKKSLPGIVVDTVNALIQEAWTGSAATFTQEAVVSRLIGHGLSRADIHDKGWLDFESLYRAAGWNVEFDRPAYSENYPATFTFKRRPEGR